MFCGWSSLLSGRIHHLENGVYRSHSCRKGFVPGRGGARLADGRGSAARFSERYPSNYRNLHFIPTFMMNFGGERPIFWLVFASFSITHPCLWKICRKRDPCLENFGPKTHQASHTRTLNMLCTPRWFVRHMSLLCWKTENLKFQKVLETLKNPKYL